MNGYKIQGEKWVNADYGAYAVELFRVRMVDAQGAWYSYKAENGVVLIRLLRTSGGLNRFRDLMIRFSTASATNEAPSVQVYDPELHKTGTLTWRIKVKDDGYAYFYAKGSDRYDRLSYQLLYARYPAFIEPTGGTLITLAEFRDSSDCLQYVTPKNGFEDGTITFNGTYCQNSTSAAERPLELIWAGDRLMMLVGNVTLYTSAPIGTVLFTLSRGSLNKPTVIYGDVYAGYETLDYAAPAFLQRVPFRIATNGAVSCLQAIGKPAHIHFNSHYVTATDNQA